MPLFICDICGCVENTAWGHYWGRNDDYFADPDLKGKALCRDCAPTEYADGSKNEIKRRRRDQVKRFPTEEEIKAGYFINRPVVSSIQYCYYCRKETETIDGDCVVCGYSKQNEKS